MPPSPTTATNPASTLGDVLGCVRDMLVAVGSFPIESILMGKENLVSVDAPPRVVFVPEQKGTWGDPPTGTGGMGYVAGKTHGCDVYVWGIPNADSFLEWVSADSLSDDVMNAIHRAARGRIEGGTYDDPSPQSVSKYGETIRFKFLYSRGVQQNRRIWSLPSNPIATSPPDINKPPGTPQSAIAPLNLTVTPQ